MPTTKAVGSTVKGCIQNRKTKALNGRCLSSVIITHGTLYSAALAKNTIKMEKSMSSTRKRKSHF